ncbi:MAG: cbpC [Oscillospiraceae bacterium]|jgi:glucan-binding YG repeat protein|nr:cbpC [Oscillospiraceae bacterium]
MGDVDGAFIPYTNNGSNNINFDNMFEYDVGFLDSYNQNPSALAIGQTVYKNGFKTGLTSGKITNLNFVAFGTKLIQCTNYVIGGDSGGPVYYRNTDGSTTIIGITSARTDFGGGNIVTDFTEAYKFLHAFNLNFAGGFLYEWKQIGGKWYYFNTLGQLSIGWEKIDGYWYYFDPNGMMYTGWKYRDGYWYYLDTNGQMLKGWQKIGGKWFYLRPSGSLEGAMATGLWQIERFFYYLNTDGSMFTGTKTIDGQSCTFDASSGKLMKTGWMKFYGYWYYAWGDYKLAKGTATIGGKTYYFDDNCVCANP